MTCGIEDAGFEIRDTIMWLYGSGFPKSLNIGKQIDKLNGKRQEEFIALGKYLKEKRGEIPQNQISKFFPSKTGGLTGCVSNWELGMNVPTKEQWIILKKELKLDNKFDYLIDRIEAEREVVGQKTTNLTVMQKIGETNTSGEVDITLPATQEAKQWNGWGTALKPAVEPIVVARKPLSEKNVALNVLKHGTGGLNIDECRINYVNDKDFDFSNRKNYRDYDIKKPAFETFSGDKKTPSIASETSETNLNTQGRFPANIILDEDAGKMLDEQSGILKGEIGRANRKDNNKHKETLYDGGWKGKVTETSIKDKGGASRFFYCAKERKRERNFGCDSIENIRGGSMDANVGKVMELGGASLKGNPKELKKVKNNHPTVKPIALIEYLIKLVSRKGAIVLDPFLGSGTTAIACLKLERQFIGIEKEEEYIEIAKARIKPFREQRKL